MKMEWRWNFKSYCFNRRTLFSHPVAEVVVKAAKQRGFVHMHHEEVEFIVAHGVKTEVEWKIQLLLEVDIF